MKWLIAGLMVGGIIGVLVMALCNAASRADAWMNLTDFYE